MCDENEMQRKEMAKHKSKASRGDHGSGGGGSQSVTLGLGDFLKQQGKG
jgi:hypothetical protein